MPNATPELDVRVIPPRDKHPTIFRTFDGLAVGDSFVLVNDHDPFPLRYQFEAQRAGEFAWAYREAGPIVWRVEILRVAETGGDAPRDLPGGGCGPRPGLPVLDQPSVP